MIKLKKYFIILFIAGIGIFFNYKYINQYPSSTHAWAQADRYAISMGFLDNGMNFFKPQTYIYNHQFPDFFKTPNETTITSVDFPIHEYVVAVFMKITGITSPWVFRVYVLLYSFIGLYFLFKLSLLITKSKFKSFVVVAFTATSPVFVYYQANFLVSIPSFANALIGVYFYLKYKQFDNKKMFGLGILFLTLSALSRTTFLIPLVAVLGLEFLTVLKNNRHLIFKLKAVLLSLAAIIGYFLYNGYLRDNYGSIFLGNLMIPEDYYEIKKIIELTYNNWKIIFLSTYHYLFLFILLAFFIITFIVKKERPKDSSKTLLYLISIIMLGCFCFAYLMLYQFVNHDYYFIDTFFLPIILLVVFLINYVKIPDKKTIKHLVYGLLLTPLFFGFTEANKVQNERKGLAFSDRGLTTVKSYENIEELFIEAGVKKDAKVLVMPVNEPNFPFLLMDRKGYVMYHKKREDIDECLTWDYDFIVIQNDFFVSEIYSIYPEITNKLKKVASNGRITICKLKTDTEEQSLFDFLATDRKAVFEEKIDFEKDAYPVNWEHLDTTSLMSFSGNKSGVLKKDEVYGLAYRLKSPAFLMNNQSQLYITSKILSDSVINASIVVAIDVNNEAVYYNSYSLTNVVKATGNWEDMIMIFNLPEIKDEDSQFILYFYNPEGSELYIDDFSIKLF